MTADDFTPLGIRNWCAQRVAEIAPHLPHLADIRVSVGSYAQVNCVSVSGFHRESRRFVNFSADTVEGAVKAALAANASANPQPKR